MREFASKILGQVLVTGGLAFTGATLAWMLQMPAFEVRLEALEKLQHPGEFYRDFQNDRIQGIRDRLDRLDRHEENFNHSTR